MAVNVVQNALSSRRLNRWLPWIAGAVLAAGVIAFLIAYFGNTANSKETFSPGKPQTFQPQRTVPLPRGARLAAAKFISTAVARRDLDQAWPLATANVRGGLTYKEWLSGDIRVPALGAPIQTAAITKIVASHPREAEINVVVIPKPNKNGVKTTLFFVIMKKIGSRWMVDYCQAQASPGAPVPS
ncbi:MAG TPA: hypothetical protein VE753_06025 [Gaiellaceae bacterium]|jgi:hypothetical protein|nr:hypothetical protein [Gaiellaceae bacterium]